MDIFYDKIAKIYKKISTKEYWNTAFDYKHSCDVSCDYRDMSRNNSNLGDIYKDKDVRLKELDMSLNHWLVLWDRVELLSCWYSDWVFEIIDRSIYKDTVLNVNNVLYTVKSVDG